MGYALRMLCGSSVLSAFALIPSSFSALARAATMVYTVVDTVIFAASLSRTRRPCSSGTEQREGLTHDPILPVTFMDYKALPVFSERRMVRPDVNLADPGMDPVRVKTIETSPNLFSVLGVGTQVGEGFPKDGPFFARTPAIVVISDRLWRTRYGADPGILGKQLNLNGSPHTVVGVMPAGFHFPDDVDVWQRLKWDLSQHSRSAHFMEAVARLSDGTSLERRTRGRYVWRPGRERIRTEHKGWSFGVVPLLNDKLGYYRPAAVCVVRAVGLLFVRRLLNVASFSLTRALRASGDCRANALGAALARSFTQLLAESLILSIAGVQSRVSWSRGACPLIALSPVPFRGSRKLRSTTSPHARLGLAGHDLHLRACAVVDWCGVRWRDLKPASAGVREARGVCIRDSWLPRVALAVRLLVTRRC